MTKKKKPENSKGKALEAALAQLKKRFGDGTIMKMGEAPDLRVESHSNRLNRVGFGTWDWRRAAWSSR